MDEIINTLRTEARSYDRMVNRCETSLNFIRQTDGAYAPGGQRRELNAEMAEASANAQRIRHAIVNLEGVTS